MTTQPYYPLIISASYKTDIPAFYGEWFMKRLDKGYTATLNPYNQKPFPIGLTKDDAIGFVFWTKNIGPFMPYLDEVRDRGFPFVIQHTINGYAQSRFEAVISADDAIENLCKISKSYGPHVAVWRYDPIVLSSKTPAEAHLKNFDDLAHRLKGRVNEVVVSFVQPYKKTRRNMDDRENRYDDFTWLDRDGFQEIVGSSRKQHIGPVVVPKSAEEAFEEKKKLAKALAAIASMYGMYLSICSQKDFLDEDPEKKDKPDGRICAAHCVEHVRMLDVAKSDQFKDKVKTDFWLLESDGKYKQIGNREECACFASRDLGDYDTCPYGCAYCYAVSKPETAKAQYKAHRPDSVFLNSQLDEQHQSYITNELEQRLEERRVQWRKRRDILKSKAQQQPTTTIQTEQPLLFPNGEG